MSIDSTIRREDIEIALDYSGMIVRGVLLAETAKHAQVPWPDQRELGFSPAALVLIGNAGQRMWTRFKDSPQKRDDVSEPLDRWTRDTLCAVASQLARANNRVEVVFPFDGPPFLPFQRWASACEPVAVSPLGLLMHARYGLWHAFRGAFWVQGFEAKAGLYGADEVADGCVRCESKACLTTCPVDAFSVPRGKGEASSHYDIDSCVNSVKGADSACADAGCLARLACPYAREWTYASEQQRFHLTAFVDAMSKMRW